MTHITKAPHDDAERAKWRVQADNAAAHMKSVKDWGAQLVFQPAFVFDDGIVKLPINVSLIQKLSEQALADWVFETVLEAQQPITPAGGESADAPKNAPGMEPSLAAAQAPAVTGNGSPALTGTSQPAAAAVVEPCMRKLEPDYTQKCPNHATGGLRITLKPSPTVSKRWGMTSMLTFVMDLPVCPGCFPKVNIMEITDQDLRARLGKTAQQMNNGVLVDWKQTFIEHVGFDDPQLAGLREQMAKRERSAASDSQPGPAGPQSEGAGDGTDGPGGRAA